MELNNIVGFKAIDADGNEQNVTVDEMVDMVATRMVSALSETSSLSEISTLATAAATGNDVYENELPTVTDAANVRVLQSSGDAAQMTMQSLATKLGGLMNNLNLFPFMRRGILEKNTDFNNITESGIYTYTSLASFTNSPDNDYGILLVFNGSGYLIQEAMQVVNNLIIKYRSGVVVDGKFQWHDWKQIETK